MQLYGTRHDKNWSLTDCFSFVVMEQRRLVQALATDHHFRQAGFERRFLTNRRAGPSGNSSQRDDLEHYGYRAAISATPLRIFSSSR